MSKMYKGYELIKEIAIGNIKNDTKIIPHYPNNDCTVDYFKYRYGFLEAYHKNDVHSDNRVNVCIFLDNNRTFEVIEDEIDIDSIEEIDLFDNGQGFENIKIVKESYDNNFTNITTIINELIKAVKQLNKKIKEKE